MSGTKDSSNDGVVGSIETLTFRTSREDSDYKYPLEGLATGTSVSHVALRMTFDRNAVDPELLERVRNLNQVTGKNIFNESDNGKCSLYFSFWPGNDWDPVSTTSRLETHDYDTRIAATGTPMQMNKRFAEYLEQDHKVVSPFLPIAKSLIRTNEPLGPSITLHTSLLANTYGKDAAEKGVEYCKKYEAWCDAELDLDNYKQHRNPSEQELSKLQDSANKSLKDMNFALGELKNAINQGAKESGKESIKDNNSNLMPVLEKFFTFGINERDSAALPLLSSDKNNGLGLDVNGVLNKVCDVAEHPDNYPYNVALFNCAHLAHSVQMAGVTDNTNARFASALEVPLFAELTPMPIVPGMVLHSTIGAGKVAEQEKSNATPGGRGMIESVGAHLRRAADFLTDKTRQSFAEASTQIMHHNDEPPATEAGSKHKSLFEIPKLDKLHPPGNPD